MKNKVIFSFVFSILLVFSIVCANSYVQARSRQEVRNYRSMEGTNEICEDIEKSMPNYCNDYEHNENCPLYQQNEQCLPNYNHRSDNRNHHRCNR